VHTGLWWGDQRERNDVENLKANERVILKWNLRFMDPCIVRVFQYVSNKIQRNTVYFIWKLLYMFRVVPPPIIRSAYNDMCSI
jgi:hypothetical protein